MAHEAHKRLTKHIFENVLPKGSEIQLEEVDSDNLAKLTKKFLSNSQDWQLIFLPGLH